MYGTLLLIHSLLRWLVLIAGIVAVARALQALSKGESYETSHRTTATVFVSSLHLNLLLGIALYVGVSPITQAAFADIGAAMKSSALRFFLVEHPFGMLVGTIVATVGSSKLRRTVAARAKHRVTAIFFGIGLLIVLASIPWPFYPAGRPLFWLPF